MDIPSLRRETRYGMPAADQVLFNRDYVLGYSYYFRQAKWALEIVDPSPQAPLPRADNFRPDLRVPENFRADLVDYSGSGFHRGHLVASANQSDDRLFNSETFLLSNMAPMRPGFNNGIWKLLEHEIRLLASQEDVFETYVICGPAFFFDRAVECIGENDSNEVSVPVPHAFFKSVLTENHRGTLRMWSFLLANDNGSGSLTDYRVPTVLLERLAGIKLWQRLVGAQVEKEKRRVRSLW
jgi:endonuclease G